MNLPSRFEIEKFANERFEADLERRINEYARKQARALAQVRSRGNIGGYLPALIQCKQERLRTEILALADAWVEAGTIYAVPLHVSAEEAFEKATVLMAAGTISALRGELDLMAKRTRIPRSNTAGNREIASAMKSALREGKLRLKTQRIQADRLPAAPSHGPKAQAESGGPASIRKAFVEPILTTKGWSILDWANNSEVDFHTANDYLKGTTKPYRSTRKKLADSLGVDASALPT